MLSKRLFFVINRYLRTYHHLYQTNYQINNLRNYPINVMAQQQQQQQQQQKTLTTKKDVKTVTFEEVKSVKNNKNVLLIDVREPSELKETGIIPGSINIPLGQLESTLKNLSDSEFSKKYGRDKPGTDYSLIFSCRSGKRSATAMDTALKLGFKNVKHFAGGWLEWESKIKH